MYTIDIYIHEIINTQIRVKALILVYEKKKKTKQKKCLKSKNSQETCPSHENIQGTFKSDCN